MLLNREALFVIFCAITTCVLAQTDYTTDEALRLLFRGIPLTFGRLLNGNDSIGPINEEVTFWCINRNTNQVIQTFINDPNITAKVDVTKPLYTVTHGWLDNVNRTWVQGMLRDILIFADVNACAVDWNKMANFEYSITATKHVPPVGDYLAQFIEYLSSLGISLDNVSMVGHSFGGQICGQAGMRLGGNVGAIYGLDPAGPLFCFPLLNPTNKRLDPSDAKFVQIMHSSDGTIGCQVDHGHQDFRTDGGYAPQTGCVIPFANQAHWPGIVTCSHAQPIQYFRFSLNPANVYSGRQCSSYTSFTLFLCRFNPTEIMGPRTGRRIGRFFLRTSFSAPYTV